MGASEVSDLSEKPRWEESGYEQDKDRGLEILAAPITEAELGVGMSVASPLTESLLRP